jgi:hypothetical protein
MRELAEELVRRNHTVTWFEYGLFERRKEIPLPAGVKEVFVAVDPAGENKKLRGIYQVMNECVK